jgi:hypothetical protein
MVQDEKAKLCQKFLPGKALLWTPGFAGLPGKASPGFAGLPIQHYQLNQSTEYNDYEKNTYLFHSVTLFHFFSLTLVRGTHGPS